MFHKQLNITQYQPILLIKKLIDLVRVPEYGGCHIQPDVKHPYSILITQVEIPCRYDRFISIVVEPADLIRLLEHVKENLIERLLSHHGLIFTRVLVKFMPAVRTEFPVVRIIALVAHIILLMVTYIDGN